MTGREPAMWPFLSPEWIEQAHARVAHYKTQLPGDHALVFEHYDEDLGTVVHSQLWTDGLLSAWIPDRCDNPDAVVRFDLWAAYMWFFGRSPVGATLEIVDTEGGRWSVPPTSTQLGRTSSSRPVKGLSFAAQVTVPDHPFGKQTQTYRFSDGVALVGDQDVPDSDPLVSVSVPFDGAISFLLGGLPFRDIASRSSISGDVLLFATLAGLLAPPEVLRAHSVVHRAAKYGIAGLVRIGNFRPLLQDLEAQTVVP